MTTVVDGSHVFADGDIDYVSNLNDVRTTIADIIDELDINADTDGVSPRSFGAVGDYNTDDTAAILDFLDHLNTTGKSGYLGDGVYRVTESIDFPEGIRLFGNGPPNLNTFILSEDKSNLRPGYKHLIKGSAIIFDGTATKTYTTNRADAYSSFTYMASYLYLTPCQMDGFALILDCDVFNAGGTLTTAAADNRSNYDAGLVVRSQLASFNNINIFGYFDRAGFIVHSQISYENVDSDYIRMNNSNICSIALIAKDTSADNGLTGFIGVNNGYYSAADHHTQADGDYTIPAIYIDGDNGSAGIRGSRFHGNVRTHSNVVVSLDKCDDVVFDCTWETPTLVGVPNADASGVIQGTSSTNDIRVMAAASGVSAGLGLDILASTIGGSLITVGGKSGCEILVSKAGKGVRIGQDTTGDGYFQLTNDFTTANSGWMIKRDESAADNFSIRYANTERLAMDISGNLSVDATINSGTDLISGSGIVKANGSSTELDLRSGGTSANARIRLGGTTAFLLTPSVATFTVSTAVRSTSDGTVSNGALAQRWSDTYSVNIRPGTGTVIWTSGAGSPESVVTAPVGSLYTRTDGGAATTLYVKESGSGNTGWVAK